MIDNRIHFTTYCLIGKGVYRSITVSSVSSSLSIHRYHRSDGFHEVEEEPVPEALEAIHCGRSPEESEEELEEV